MVARGYFQLAKLCPIGIYLKDLQTAPNSRLWMLRLIRELCSDLQNVVSSASTCPIGIYLKDLLAAPNSRLWMLRRVRELCFDMHVCPLNINLMDPQFETVKHPQSPILRVLRS